MPHQIDDTDLQIIRMLQEGARQTNQEIAEKIGLAPSTLTRRLQWLEDNNCIKGYTCIIDPKIMGYNTLCFAMVEFSSPSKKLIETVIERFKGVPEVTEICKVLGDEDLIVKLYAKDNAHYQKILESITSDDKQDGYRTKTLLVTEIPYSGGIADIFRKIALQQVQKK